MSIARCESTSEPSRGTHLQMSEGVGYSLKTFGTVQVPNHPHTDRCTSRIVIC
jgi:hypothetical protein